MRKAIVFTEPGKAELQEQAFDVSLNPTEIAVETQISVLSAGTELAVLRGTESWAKLPVVPGYGSIGKLIAKGDAVTGLDLGDFVYTNAGHASTAVCDSSFIAMKVPDGIDLKKAVVCRMAQVAMTSLRVSTVELGDTVVVQGLGLVGNLAAQFLSLQGATVIGVDISQKRLDTAKQCGIDHVVNAMETDPVEAVNELTHGQNAQTVIESTGVPDLVLTALKMAKKNGECILLGSPRGELKGDVMEVLNRVHLWEYGCVTLKGAHEWRFPLRENADGGGKHSIERNVRVFWDLIRTGKVNVEALISHVESPAACGEVYDALQSRDEDYFGVLWDWSKL